MKERGGTREGEEGTRERSERLRSHVVHQEGTRRQKETTVEICQLKGTPEARQEDL